MGWQRMWRVRRMCTRTWQRQREQGRTGYAGRNGGTWVVDIYELCAGLLGRVTHDDGQRAFLGQGGRATAKTNVRETWMVRLGQRGRTWRERMRSRSRRRDTWARGDGHGEGRRRRGLLEEEWSIPLVGVNQWEAQEHVLVENKCSRPGSTWPWPCSAAATVPACQNSLGRSGPVSVHYYSSITSNIRYS